MNHPSEKQLETYVRTPEELSPDEIRRVEHFIKTEEETRLIAEWFHRFYQQYDAILSEANKLMSAKERIPSSIVVKPLPEVKKNGRNVFVLAAQTGSSGTKRTIEQIRTFASKKFGMVVRVLNLKVKRSTKIDVISDHVKVDDIVIISVPDTDISLVTKPGGKVEVSSDKISGDDVKNWESFRVNLPVLKSKISRKRSSQSGFVMAHSSAGVKSVEVQQAVDHVEIYPDETMAEVLSGMMVLAEEDTTPTLWNIKNGKVVIPGNRFRNRNLSLFFYN